MADSKKNKPGKFLQDLDDADYLSIFDEFSDGVIVTNAKGVIVYYNHAMSRIDELDPETVISRKLTDVYDLDETTSVIWQCLKQQKRIIDEPIYYRTRMGKFANTIHNVMPIFNRGRLVVAMVLARE